MIFLNLKDTLSNSLLIDVFVFDLCAEVGVNMESHYTIKYTFDKIQGLSSTDFRYIRVGFITKKKKGILIQLRNEDNTEYLSLEMNNNGRRNRSLHTTLKFEGNLNNFFISTKC